VLGILPNIPQPENFPAAEMVKYLQIAALSILLTHIALASNSCASITCNDLMVPGAEVVSVTSIEGVNVTIPPTSGLNFCNVSVILTHPGANDSVLVEVWLPTDGWNGRFQATGGGGFSSGFGDGYLAPVLAQGYATSQTDGGNIGSGFVLNPQALSLDGQVNWGLLVDYSYRSIHDMAVVAKAVIQAYYGKAPNYSYWNGCSTGGRQGMVHAQLYPGDYDGILAASPAINAPSFVMGIHWPYTVLQQEEYVPSQCEFSAFVNASIAKCDGLDGVEDGIISNLQDCEFDPYSIVGQKISCDGKKITITKATAGIYQKIYNGATTTSGRKLWYGFNTGTGFNGLYPSDLELVTVNGTTTAIPPPLSDNYITYLLEKDPSYNTSGITYADFDKLFAQSILEYDWILGDNNPDLSQFRGLGGKLISWHGLADSLIFPNGSLDYRQRVDDQMGGTSAVDHFYRQFFVPGVNHCGGGYGPVPTDPLSSLIAWVEQGQAPETIAGQYVDVQGAVVDHNICRYPLVSRYDGKGDPKSADSYTCATSFGAAG
jgi:hypothetical protein